MATKEEDLRKGKAQTSGEADAVEQLQPVPESAGAEAGPEGQPVSDPKIRELEKKLDEFRKLRAEDQLVLMKEIQERVELRKEQTRYQELHEREQAEAAQAEPGLAAGERGRPAVSSVQLTPERILQLEPEQAITELAALWGSSRQGPDQAVRVLKQAYPKKREAVPHLIDGLQNFLVGQKERPTDPGK